MGRVWWCSVGFHVLCGHSDWLWSHAFELILILKVICTGGGWVRLARLTVLYCQWNILILIIISFLTFLTCPKFLGVLIVLVTNSSRTCLCLYLYFIRCTPAEYALQIKSLMGISLVPRPHLRERVWWHLADTSGFINVDYFLERNFSPPIT